MASLSKTKTICGITRIYMIMLLIVLMIILQYKYLNTDSLSFAMEPFLDIIHEDENTYLYSFGNQSLDKYKSVHLMTFACVNASGIYYIHRAGNSPELEYKQRLHIHTELWSSFSNVAIHSLNTSTALNFSDKTAFLLWTSNLENIYHFLFSLIGGWKALYLIHSNGIKLDIHNIQLIYFGSFFNVHQHTNLEYLYHKLLTNYTKNIPLSIRDLTNNKNNALKCYKKVIIGRASHWEINANDFTALAHKMNTIYSTHDVCDKHVDEYIKCGANNNYLNIVLLQRRFPRRHIINIQDIKQVLMDTFADYVSTQQISIFKRNRINYFSDRFVNKSVSNILWLNIIELQFENMNIADQFKVMYHSDILISSHGAALSWNLFMFPQSYIVELFPENTQKQCAKCRNHKYLHSWSTFAEIAQWRHSHHFCIVNDANNVKESKQRNKYIEIHFDNKENADIEEVFGKTRSWMDSPYLLSNASLYKMVDILWNKKFAKVIQNETRLWCLSACREGALLKQNNCKRNMFRNHCDRKEKSYCLT